MTARRLLLAPAVVAVIAAVEVTRRSLWLAWPVIGMVRAVLRPEPVGPTTEPDYLA